MTAENKSRQKWTDEEILDSLRDLSPDGETAPILRRLDETDSGPSSGTVRHRFGSYARAIRAADLKPQITKHLLDEEDSGPLPSRCPHCNEIVAAETAAGWKRSPHGRPYCGECGKVHPDYQREFDSESRPIIQSVNHD